MSILNAGDDREASGVPLAQKLIDQLP